MYMKAFSEKRNPEIILFVNGLEHIEVADGVSYIGQRILKNVLQINEKAQSEPVKKSL